MAHKHRQNGQAQPPHVPVAPQHGIVSTVVDGAGVSVALFIDGRPYGVQFTHNGLVRIQVRDTEDAPIVNMTFADLAALYENGTGRRIIPPGIVPS